jgi:hypothetical protein
VCMINLLSYPQTILSDPATYSFVALPGPGFEGLVRTPVSKSTRFFASFATNLPFAVRRDHRPDLAIQLERAGAEPLPVPPPHASAEGFTPGTNHSPI